MDMPTYWSKSRVVSNRFSDAAPPRQAVDLI